MSIETKKFAGGYRAVVLNHNHVVAVTIKARNDRNAAYIDGMTLRLAIQGPSKY